MSTTRDFLDAPPRVGLLSCLACGVTAECRPTDALEYTRTAWPRCCGEVMTLLIPTRHPERLTPNTAFADAPGES
jgi:hypothetical protein